MIGHEVEVRQHPDEVEVLFAGRVVERMPRVREEGGHRVQSPVPEIAIGAPDLGAYDALLSGCMTAAGGAA
jgi:hypothetical protein